MHIFRHHVVVSTKNIIAVMLLMVLSVSLSACNFQKETDILYRGPNPSMKRLDELKAMGIKTIISVRNNPSEKKEAYAKKIGLKWLTVKTSVMKSPKLEDIRRFITMVNTPENQPVYVCCVGGRDRSVFYATAYKIAVLGADPEESVKQMKGSTWHKLWPGFRYYREILLSGAADKYGWRPDGESINAAQPSPANEKKPAASTPEKPAEQSSIKINDTFESLPSS